MVRSCHKVSVLCGYVTINSSCGSCSSGQRDVVRWREGGGVVGANLHAVLLPANEAVALLRGSGEGDARPAGNRAPAAGLAALRGGDADGIVDRRTLLPDVEDG